MNSSCPAQRVSIIDEPAQQGQAAPPSSPSPAAGPAGAQGPRASVLSSKRPHGPRCHTTPAANTRDLTLPASFRCGKRKKGICLSEGSGGTRGSQTGFSEPSDGVPKGGQGLGTKRECWETTAPSAGKARPGKGLRPSRCLAARARGFRVLWQECGRSPSSRLCSLSPAPCLPGSCSHNFPSGLPAAATGGRPRAPGSGPSPPAW